MFTFSYPNSKFKKVTGTKLSTILQSQPFELVTLVILINVVIGGFSGEDVR